VDYSPTGREFVTGSYDRTVKCSPSLISDIQYVCTLRKLVYLINLQVRIFNHNGDHSREIYHTKRMQRFSLPPTHYVSYLRQSII
jgi:DDB1- and CUL4-associated factor 13